MRIFKGLKYGFGISIVLWLLIFIIISAFASAVQFDDTAFTAAGTGTVLNITDAVDADAIQWDANWINVTNMTMNISLYIGLTEVYAADLTVQNFTLNNGSNYLMSATAPTPPPTPTPTTVKYYAGESAIAFTAWLPLMALIIMAVGVVLGTLMMITGRGEFTMADVMIFVVAAIGVVIVMIVLARFAT